jgi:hypothetical protein
MTRTLTISLVLLHLLAGSLAYQLVAQAQGTPAALVNTLAQAMTRRDRAAVAELIRYPASATVGGIGVPIGNRTVFLQLYDSIFTTELRCLVETSAANGSDIRREAAGAFTFAQGRIRAEEVAGALKITRISVPTGTRAAQQPAGKVQRVTLRTMGAKTQFSGRLYGDGVDGYIVSLRKGDVVEARIEQFPGRSAALHVVEQKTGKSLDRPALKTSDGRVPAPRIWKDTIRETGEYRIEVVRLAPYCEPSFTYLLTITVM